MIAVISYTGYDLEDSICVNKMARERGLMYGTIYKTKMVDLEDESRNLGYRGGLYLGCKDKHDPNEVALYRQHAGTKLDLDGLPYIGTIFEYEDKIYAYYDEHEGKYKSAKYDSRSEEAIVDSVRVFENKQENMGFGKITQAAIQFRISRPVNIGDKVGFIYRL